MSRVTLTINLELSIPGLPSQEALNAAMQRAESAAAHGEIQALVCSEHGPQMLTRADEAIATFRQVRLI